MWETFTGTSEKEFEDISALACDEFSKPIDINKKLLFDEKELKSKRRRVASEKTMFFIFIHL